MGVFPLSIVDIGQVFVSEVGYALKVLLNTHLHRTSVHRKALTKEASEPV